MHERVVAVENVRGLVLLHHDVLVAARPAVVLHVLREATRDREHDQRNTPRRFVPRIQMQSQSPESVKRNAPKAALISNSALGSCFFYGSMRLYLNLTSSKLSTVIVRNK